MGVCGTSLWAWKDCVITSASLLPQPLSYSLSFIDKSRWRIFTLSQILLYLKKIFAFCSPRDFFSLPTTSLSVSVKSNFSFKFKPELCPEISSSYSGVIFCISCYFAFRETESYLAEFYCSYQGHTAPIIKRAELLPCRTQGWKNDIILLFIFKKSKHWCESAPSGVVMMKYNPQVLIWLMVTQVFIFALFVFNCLIFLLNLCKTMHSFIKTVRQDFIFLPQSRCMSQVLTVIFLSIITR